ncbi:chemokine XC receptor 1-like [Neoarius graeffei]|uniref:chemokine XC receptor 1-like n=1 Tax=Neoarius graeffei TaxID=443677 RepID=UPI00298D1183|nr:chemokine XC receptor 1-like [Neoarius graeffei]XP_060792777.1 chemokine XC receptor 1-like [Neoarius graeffei]
METTTVFDNEDDAYENLFYEYEEYNTEFKASDPYIAIPIILSIVILLSLIGHVLVVAISVFYLRLQSPIIFFIRNLAVSDLLFTVYLVFWVYDHIWGFTLRIAAWKAAHFIFAVGFYSTLVFLVLMSVQRYTSVVHSQSSWKKGCCVTLCAWAVSILVALPALLNIVPDAQYYTYSIFAAVIVALVYKHIIIVVWAFLIMGFCYIRILQTIFKSPTNQRHRITGLAFFLVATYFIFWAPFNIMLFLDILRYHQMITYNMEHFSYAWEICRFLAYTRCCLNPVIYGLFGIKYRKEMREIFEREVIPNSAEMGTTEHHQLQQFN